MNNPIVAVWGFVCSTKRIELSEEVPGILQHKLGIFRFGKSPNNAQRLSAGVPLLSHSFSLITQMHSTVLRTYLWPPAETPYLVILYFLGAHCGVRGKVSVVLTQYSSGCISSTQGGEGSSALCASTASTLALAALAFAFATLAFALAFALAVALAVALAGSDPRKHFRR